jgi:transposase|tara:strand:+ start:3277 stop:3549 length:273 start_codon:yes stop_codon:yes gene_type:complete
MTKQTSQATISTIGIDIGKNSFHVIGFDERGAIVLRQKLSRGQVAVRFANLPRCLIGMWSYSGLCLTARNMKRQKRWPQIVGFLKHARHF